VFKKWQKVFRGGVHPNDRKSYSASKPIEVAALPDKVVIPVRQHIGAPCTPVVNKVIWLKRDR
jgi:electron transport complex protein RnfC